MSSGAPAFKGHFSDLRICCAGRRTIRCNVEIGVHAAYNILEAMNGSLDPVVSSAGNATFCAFLDDRGLDIDVIVVFVTPPPNRNAPLTPSFARSPDIPILIASGDVTGIFGGNVDQDMCCQTPNQVQNSKQAVDFMQSHLSATRKIWRRDREGRIFSPT
jgi:hypothetical protein